MCVCVCVCVCVCLCTYIYMHTYVCIPMHVCICMYAYIYSYTTTHAPRLSPPLGPNCSTVREHILQEENTFSIYIQQHTHHVRLLLLVENTGAARRQL